MSGSAASPRPNSTAGAVGSALGRLVRGVIGPARRTANAPAAARSSDAPGVSTAAALGTTAGRTVRNSRGVFRGLRAGVGAFLARLRHVVAVLFLEVMGLFFLLFAVVVSGLAWTEYRAYHAGGHGPARLEVAIGLAAMFFYFGVSSFWRSHRKARRMNQQ